MVCFWHFWTLITTDLSNLSEILLELILIHVDIENIQDGRNIRPIWPSRDIKTTPTIAEN